jgi:hypothetical protein
MCSVHRVAAVQRGSSAPVWHEMMTNVMNCSPKSVRTAFPGQMSSERPSEQTRQRRTRAPATRTCPSPSSPWPAAQAPRVWRPNQTTTHHTRQHQTTPDNTRRKRGRGGGSTQIGMDTGKGIRRNGCGGKGYGERCGERRYGEKQAPKQLISVLARDGTARVL